MICETITCAYRCYYSWLNLGSNYKYNHDKDAKYDPKEFLAGSQRFQVKQIEVFKEIK